MAHQGGDKLKPDLSGHIGHYGGMKVGYFVVEKRKKPKSYNDPHPYKICLLFGLFTNFKIFLLGA